MTSSGVVVTGIGAASALGTGIAAHRAALFEGRDGIRPVDRFDTTSMSAHLAATWPEWDGRSQPLPNPERDLASTAEAFPLHELALVAAREAWLASGAVADRERAALVFGTCFGHGFDEFSAVARRIATGLDLAGPCITISTACSSSTNAIGLARDLLLNGHADVVVAGGADALLREGFAGFAALGVLSTERCAPFSLPVGTTMGEGAAFVVLERIEDAARRTATTWAHICGYGLSGDAFHETTPDPSGNGVARAIRGALDDAGWSAHDVEYVNAHATGTANNDRIEWAAIQRELGTPHVSGTKGHIGHTQGAAGALELVLALVCHREGCVPPTMHFRGARDGCPADPIASDQPRALPVARALKLSAAFGGANAALAYACNVAPRVRRSTSRPRSHVVLTGTAVVGPAGAFTLHETLALATKQNVGPCCDVDLDALGVDGRRLDRSARALTAAAALALSNRARKDGAETTGLFVAATRMPDQSSKRCTESIRLRGVAGTSASAFARMSVNAPTGACSQALGLLGPTSTFSIGEGSGLLAVALAAEWLALRHDARSMLACSVNELSGSSGDETAGAACIALTQSSHAERNAVVVASWGLAGPHGALDAAARAMRGRALVDGLVADGDTSRLERWLAPHAALGVIDTRRAWGAAEATRSCVVATIAAAHIAAGHARSILVVASGGAASVAIVFERGGDP